jgi:putative DNA primase/helicase
MHAITRPLYRVEENWRVEYESEVSGFEQLKEQEELCLQAYREQYKRATKKGEALPVRPDTSQASPHQKRLLLTDSTVEKLHEILAQNPAGVLVVRDELTGLLAQMERPGRETERAFYLQAWNGNSGFTMDRIGRGSIYVPAVCISLLGNIQPARLRWYLAQTVDGGPNDDGLFQRFQILVWPDLPRTWRLVDRPPNNIAVAQMERIYNVLANLSADDPVQLRFSPYAQQLFFAWLSDLEGKVRGPGLAPIFASHLAKYRSLMPTVAGIFSLVDSAARPEALSGNLLIGLEHARQAAALCEYLEAHARRIYACVASPELWAARELGRHIQADDLPDVFTTRAVYQHGWAGLDGPERTRCALAQLEEANWVRQLENLSTGKGRPSQEWQINPKVVRHVK